MLVPIVLCVAFIAAKCNENLYTPQVEAEQGNQNSNSTQIRYSTRLEIPKLKEGANLFLVKTVPTFGVNYCAEYNTIKRSARWIAYRWDINNATDNEVGRNEKWAEDEDIPEECRVKLSDHTYDDYDRGHMLASEDRQNSKEANRQTFLMTNILPQYNKFNGTSAKRSYVWVNLEKRVREFYENWTPTQNAQDTIYAVKGGTIDHEHQILEVTAKGLVVPKYFYMAFLYKSNTPLPHGYKAMAFWVEHTNGRDTTKGNELKKYIVSIDQLEEYTGIDFFCNLPDDIENEVEAITDPNAWGFK